MNLLAVYTLIFAVVSAVVFLATATFILPPERLEMLSFWERLILTLVGFFSGYVLGNLSSKLRHEDIEEDT